MIAKQLAAHEVRSTLGSSPRGRCSWHKLTGLSRGSLSAAGGILFREAEAQRAVRTLAVLFAVAQA